MAPNAPQHLPLPTVLAHSSLPLCNVIVSSSSTDFVIIPIFMEKTADAQKSGEKGIKNMIPQQWTPPCNSRCTNKYAALMQIPWRVFCKKGCDSDGDTWDECLGECDEICYKDPVLKDQKWSAYIDRSPGSVSYSEECFRACIAGCGYKFEIPLDQINHVNSRSPKLSVEEKPAAPPALEPITPRKSILTKDEIPSTSA